MLPLYTQAANSNGLFSPVGRVLGVSTNGAAPPISSLSVVPVDARTNATRISLVMDAPGNPCRVWYTVLPLRDAVLLHVEDFSAEEIVERASADESVVDLPQVPDAFPKKRKIMSTVPTSSTSSCAVVYMLRTSLKTMSV